MSVSLAMNTLPASKQKGWRCVFANTDLWATGGLTVLVSSGPWVKLKSWIKERDSLGLKSQCPCGEHTVLFTRFYYKKLCPLYYVFVLLFGCSLSVAFPRRYLSCQRVIELESLETLWPNTNLKSVSSLEFNLRTRMNIAFLSFSWWFWCKMICISTLRKNKTRLPVGLSWLIGEILWLWVLRLPDPVLQIFCSCSLLGSRVA